jgi:cytochrome c5
VSQQETIPIKNLTLGIGAGFGIVALFIFTVLLITQLGLEEHHGESEEQIQERIKPVGQVQVEGEEAVATAPVKPAAPVVAPKSGKEIYESVCKVCHATAVLGAPKLDDKANWEKRFAQGEATLINHAINGFFQMPARGGANISDEEVKRTVRYMLAEAGLVSAAEPPETAPAEKPPAVTPAVAAKSGKEIYEAKCELCHKTGVIGAPKYGDKAGWAERVAKGEATLIQSAINGLNAMPPRGGDINLSDEEVKGAVQYMLQAVGAASLTTPPETAPAEKPPVVEKPAVDGKQVYNSACALCHAEGILGAPKLGDQDSWAPRVAKGMDTLLTHALNGFKGETGVMPAKGGKMDLSTEKVKAAIEYMVSQVPAVATDTSAAEEVAPTPDSPAPSKTAPTEAPVVAKDTTPTTEPEPTAKPEATAFDLELGKEVYTDVCSVCHATGISGAPVLGNKDSWAPRLKKGMDVLFTSALKGLGAMPPKGGRLKYPDEKIKSAVAYMVDAVKGDDDKAAMAPTTTTPAAGDKISATTPSMPKSVETMAPALPTSAPSANSEDSKMYHTVQLGESLYGIAARYGQKFSDVTAWNNIKSPYNLSVGQRLLVSAPNEP